MTTEELIMGLERDQGYRMMAHGGPALRTA